MKLLKIELEPTYNDKNQLVVWTVTETRHLPSRYVAEYSPRVEHYNYARFADAVLHVSRVDVNKPTVSLAPGEIIL